MENEWIIMGNYKDCATNVVDTVSGTEQEARDLCWEYSLAFGNDWTLEVVPG